MKNVSVINNMLLNSPTSAGVVKGKVSACVIKNNGYWGNGGNSKNYFTGATDTDRIISDPKMNGPEDQYDGYIPGNPKFIDSGMDVGLPFAGPGPDIGAIEAAGADREGPEIGGKTPSDGHIYTSGTRIATLSIDASDGSGMTGCRWDVKDIDYKTMSNEMAEVDGTYTGTMSGLVGDMNYTVYGICRDAAGIPNDTFFIWNFSVGPDTGAVIIDNQSAEFTYNRSWNTSNYVDEYYGSNYFTSENTSTSDQYGRWTPTLDRPGLYRISEWHTSYTDRPDEAPLSVYHNGTVTSTTVNQSVNGNQWNEIGTYYFDAGSDEYVEITNMDDGRTCADAIKFEWIGAGSIIIDNLDAAFTFNRSWNTSRYVDEYHGSNYFTSETTGSSDQYGRWTPNLDKPGRYRISEWHTSYTDRPDAAPLTIHHNGTVTNTTVNQAVKGNQWNEIGIFYFAAVEGEYVEITNLDDGRTCADAVKFELIE